ncbi:MAG: hypothetical protein AAF799_16490 [Myxococcota bacterium]
MAGFPLTAWSLRHPGGDEAGVLLDRLHEAAATTPAARALEPEAVASALLDDLGSHCADACARWGASRVAVILGSCAPTIDQPLTRLSSVLGLVRRRAGVAGPAYHVAATGAGGAKALASAERMLRASLADAVLVGGIDDDQGALVLVEKHGDAFVRLAASAEATGNTDAQTLDETAVTRAMDGAWAAVGSPALGYVHRFATDDQPAHADAERRVIEERWPQVPSCTTRSAVPTEGAAAGAIDAVLAAAALVAGYTPDAARHELEHDRALVHAFSPGGHHVALLLEARA